MIIVWGSRLYGKVDEIPGGLFHVATKFGHIYYAPLVPNGTYVVLSKSGDEWQGVPTRFSWKSLLLAWGRAWLIFLGTMSLLLALMEVTDKTGKTDRAVTQVGLAAVWFGLLAATYWWKPLRYASYKRAMQLADELGMSDEGRLQLEVAYGRMTEADAEAQLRGGRRGPSTSTLASALQGITRSRR